MNCLNLNKGGITVDRILSGYKLANINVLFIELAVGQRTQLWSLEVHKLQVHTREGEGEGKKMEKEKRRWRHGEEGEKGEGEVREREGE